MLCSTYSWWWPLEECSDISQHLSGFKLALTLSSSKGCWYKLFTYKPAVEWDSAICVVRNGAETWWLRTWMTGSFYCLQVTSGSRTHVMAIPLNGWPSNLLIATCQGLSRRVVHRQSRSVDYLISVPVACPSFHFCLMSFLSVVQRKADLPDLHVFLFLRTTDSASVNTIWYKTSGATSLTELHTDPLHVPILRRPSSGAQHVKKCFTALKVDCLPIRPSWS